MTYSSAASFPFYILHHGAIVAVAYFVVRWDWPVFAKFGVLVPLAFFGTVIAFEVLRRIKPLRYALGMK